MLLIYYTPYQFSKCISTDGLQFMLTAAGRMVKEEQELLTQIKQTQNKLEGLSASYAGTLQVKFIRCGKPNCYCSKTGKRHGPYYYLERRVCGKVKTVYIGRDKKNVDHHNIQQKNKQVEKETEKSKEQTPRVAW